MARRNFVNLPVTDVARSTAAIAAGGRKAHPPEDEGLGGHGFGPFRMDVAAMPASGETVA